MEAYLSYVFSNSVSEQYSAFSSGFLKVCGGEILSLFQPSELMAMVVGNNNYNWEEMEKVSVCFKCLVIKKYGHDLLQTDCPGHVHHHTMDIT